MTRQVGKVAGFHEVPQLPFERHRKSLRRSSWTPCTSPHRPTLSASSATASATGPTKATSASHSKRTGWAPPSDWTSPPLPHIRTKSRLIPPHRLLRDGRRLRDSGAYVRRGGRSAGGSSGAWSSRGLSTHRRRRCGAPEAPSSRSRASTQRPLRGVRPYGSRRRAA